MSIKGTTSVSLTRDSLDVSDALSKVRSPDCGAISVFLGCTRCDVIDGKEVAALEYEAYEELALKIIRSLCDQVREIYPVRNLLVVHRLGVVDLEEDSIMIICVGEHRQETMKATEWLINEIKAKAPVWKQEIFKDGQKSWKENKEVFWRQ